MVLLRKVAVNDPSSDPITLEVVSSFCCVGVALLVYNSLCAVLLLLAERLLGNLTNWGMPKSSFKIKFQLMLNNAFYMTVLVLSSLIPYSPRS